MRDFEYSLHTLVKGSGQRIKRYVVTCRRVLAPCIVAGSPVGRPLDSELRCVYRGVLHASEGCESLAWLAVSRYRIRTLNSSRSVPVHCNKSFTPTVAAFTRLKVVSPWHGRR